MLNIRRSLRAAAATVLIAACAAGGAAFAQEAGTVGPPQLKDFSLEGQRTTPPANPQPQPKAEAPAPAPRAAEPAPRPAEPAPRAATPAPRATPPAQTETPPARTEAPAPAPSAAAPAPVPAIDEPIPDLVPEALPDTNAAAPVAPPVSQQPLPDDKFIPVEADPEEAPDYLQYLLYALPVALIGLLLFGLSRVRRRRQLMAEEQVREAARNELGDSLLATADAARPLPDRQPAPPPAIEPDPAPQPAPAPVISDAVRAALAAATAKRNAPAAPAQPRVFKIDAPAPAPAAAPAIPAEPVIPENRAWLEIDIEPEKATATDSEAAVHYNMILRNGGAAPAKNIRIDARLFNAADEADIMAFFQGPIHEVSGSPHVVIQPQNGIYLLGHVAMPKDKVREVRVEGRALFIPMVAINVAYDWLEDGKGRTSKSWLVGRQTEEPAAKMGAFRLDLGPRIYRQVGQREGKRVMV